MLLSTSHIFHNFHHYLVTSWCFCTNRSTIVGSNNVDVSPNSSGLFPAIFRKILLIILPDLVFGRPGVNWNQRYCNDPMFLDKLVWANRVDPDQTLIRVYTVCYSVCIFWMHFSIVKQHCSNFRIITAILLGVRIFRIFTVFKLSVNPYEPQHDKTNKVTMRLAKTLSLGIHPVWSESSLCA